MTAFKALKSLISEAVANLRRRLRLFIGLVVVDPSGHTVVMNRFRVPHTGPQLPGAMVVVELGSVVGSEAGVLKAGFVNPKPGPGVPGLIRSQP